LQYEANVCGAGRIAAQGQLADDQANIRVALPGVKAPTKSRAAALIHARFLAMREADYIHAPAWLEEALPITREAGDPWLRFCNFNDLLPEGLAPVPRVASSSAAKMATSPGASDAYPEAT